MTNLIKAEIFKLQRNKSFWVITGMTLAVSAWMHVMILTDWWMMNHPAFDQAGLSELNALATFTVPLFFNLIVSTLAGFFVSMEFSNSGVIKNQILSGNPRSRIYMAKYLVFSIGSIIVSILIPLVTAILAVIGFGQGDIFNSSSIVYLGKAYGLFALQFAGFTSMIMFIAILTEDSGKTIIFSILFTILVFVVEKLSKKPAFIEIAYEYSIFQQFSDVFQYTMTTGEIMKSILIGFATIIMITMCGIFIFNRKEIK